MPTPDEFAQALELSSVRYVEIAGRRAGSPPWDDFDDVDTEEARLMYKMEAETADGFDYHARLLLRAPFDDACFRVEVVAVFNWSDGVNRQIFDTEDMESFLVEVGEDITYPYLREALTSLAARMQLEAAPLLPLRREVRTVRSTEEAKEVEAPKVE